MAINLLNPVVNGNCFLCNRLVYYPIAVTTVQSTNQLLNSFCRIFAKTLQYYVIRMFKRVLISTPALLPAFREEGVWDLLFSGNFFYFGSSIEDTCFHTVTDIQNGNVSSNRISIHSESLYRTDVKILQVEAISFLEFAATLHENTYNMVRLLSFIFLFFSRTRRRTVSNNVIL
jgi:hypothetical protein